VLHIWHQQPIPNEAYVQERTGPEFLEERTFFIEKEKRMKGGDTESKTLASELKEGLKMVRDEMVLLWKWHGSKKRRQFEQLGRFRMEGEVYYWMYDEYSLSKLLEEAGFQEISVCSAFESQIPDWEKYRDFLDVQDGQVRKPDSLFMEALK
jgi:hypothetical protein